jgi:hypothetical protein
MDLRESLVAVATSAGISTGVTLLLQAYLTKRIEHRFALALEKHKAELAIRMQTEAGIITRRMEAYPKIVELCYRLRNMARDLIVSGVPMTALSEELQVRAKELEDLVFRFRIDLESDQLFVPIHRFKNLIQQFSRGIAESMTEATTNTEMDNLKGNYAEIEKSYPEVIKDLESFYHQQS